VKSTIRSGRVVVIPSDSSSAVAVAGVKPALVPISVPRPRSKDLVGPVLLVVGTVGFCTRWSVLTVIVERVSIRVSALLVVMRFNTMVLAPALPANASAKPITPLPLLILLISALPLL